MRFEILDKGSGTEIPDLFLSVFSASEGEKEGSLIAALASKLSSEIENRDIICVGAFDEQSLVGVIFFTLLKFNEPITVYMLAPVAVSTSCQGQGIGQALIRFGLNELVKRSVNLVVTYGDPSFYSRVGFQALSTDTIQPPMALSMPHGWLGLSLTGQEIPPINERPSCVDAFNDPVYW